MELCMTAVTKVEQCQRLQLKKNIDDRGALVFIEGNNDIPFPIARIYYFYDVPLTKARGAHAHKKLEQLVIPIAGSFTFLLDDGIHKKSVHLSNPSEGLYICPMIWREIVDCSSDSVCLVLASRAYDENDYYRNYNDFLKEAIK